MSEWPAHLAKIIPWLQAAIEAGGDTHSVEDVLRGVGEGKLHLWVGERCFAVTEFINYPRKRAFNIFLAGGAASEFPEIQHGMEAFARAGGATVFMHGGKVTDRIAQRSGWNRIGRDFKPAWIIMTKELQP